jgi:pyridoxine 5-phosphate synthase
MAATDEMVGIACEVLPEVCTLVPEKRAERTTEGGLDVAGGAAALRPRLARLHAAGIRVSLFIDPIVEQVRAAAAVGVPEVELHTGHYCDAGHAGQPAELARLELAAREALALGLKVAAGHGLDYPNVAPVAAIPGVEELNIGHSIIARALFVGLDRAVRDMLALI